MKLITRILTTVALAGMILLLVSAYSDYFSPIERPYMAYLGLLFPFILAFNIAFLIFWILARKLTQIGLTFLVLALSWGSIHAYFPWNKQDQKIPEDCIKVLTYNVKSFGWITKHTKENPHPILKYVQEQDPDIVCFQEFALWDGLTESVIRKAFKSMPYFKQVPFDLAIFSRYPILSVKKVPIDSHYNGAFVAELDINGKKVTLINNHLESTKLTIGDKEEYYQITTDPDAEKLESFAYTMYHRLTPAYKLRAGQANLIAETIKESKNPYIIVCGDFNDTPISYSRHKVKGDLVDSFVESGRGIGISYHENRFLFRIDYIFHSKNMKSYGCRVDNSIATSDHYPVMTYLQFTD